MTEKYIPYMVDGEMYDVPESKVSAFEKRYPSATIEMRVGEDIFDVPFADKDRFLKRYSDATYMYDSPNTFERKSEPKEAEDKTTVWETIGKSVAAAGVSTAKLALDLGRTAWKATIPGMLFGEDLDEVTRDMSNPITRASVKLGETAERLSREADPTGGEKGFVELLKEGKVGMAMQKALGSGLESLPMMLAASTGVGAVAYGAAMAAGNYADETRENPEIAAWKRGANAVGSAALELAVERIGGPLKNVFGKAGKELTEEAAKGILEQVARESKEEIAKRIAKGIGTLGKEGLEEGGEELLTSFGNDALGMSLDWIDGNKDYGIKAQWDQYKEQNPDADKKAFAREKAEEYFDAFLGGALSGMEISGATSAISERSKSKRQAYIDSEMKKAHELGAAMDYRDMYDVYKEVNKDIDNAAATFVNNKGEATISREFIENLTAEEAMTLSQSKDFSKEQKAALAELAWAKAGQEGLDQKIDNNVENYISEVKARINKATENGQVISGMVNGRVVYVCGGIAKNGSVHVSEDGSDGPLLVIDSENGTETTVNSKEIKNANANDSAEMLMNAEAGLRQLAEQNKETAINTISLKGKIDSIQEFAGKKIMVDLGNGIIEVEVLEVSPKTGVARIKGKKGDLGGESIKDLGADEIYDSLVRGDDGAPVIVDDGKPIEDEEVAEEETVAPTTEEAATEEVTTIEPEIAEDEDYRDGTYTILIDGKPVPVYVTNQDDQANTLVYEYEDENGNTKRGRTSISGFGEAIRQAVDFTPDAPVVEEPEVTVETPITEAAPVVDEVAEAPAEIPVTPQTIDWDVLFETDPENYFAEIQNQFGEDASDMLTAVVEASQQELDSLNKNKGKTQSEIFENVSKRKALQKKIDTLNGMIARLTSAPESEPITEPIAETPVEQSEPTTEAPVAETAPVVEEATEEVIEETEPIEVTPVAEVEPVQQPAVPVAPNPVDDPIAEAKKREAQLLALLERDGVDDNLKKDSAFNAGKQVADMFATREEYDAYEAEAADLGEYVSYFEAGVNESFSNRNNQTNTGNPQGNSVTLETEPTVENNGDQTETTQGEDTIRQGDDAVSRGTDDGGIETTDTGDQETEQELSKGESESSEQVKKEYPVRKGNATRKLLEDTFGFAKVSIPNTESKVLNTVYDFMMEMAKMLGVSPNVIGNGGWLDVANLRSNASSSAEYAWKNRTDGTVVEPRLKLKYGRISSIAHEWWHSLDHVLKYFNTSKGRQTATYNIGALDSFGVRKEVQDALADVLKAMKDSGFESRIASMKLPIKYKFYLLENEEMTARAFDAYINDKFENAGIIVENSVYERTPYQPTPEEMTVITPAFDNLFKVLKEKEGKKPGTSVLFHIGEMIEPNSEAKQLATQAVLDALEDANIEVERVTNEQAQRVLDIRNELSNVEKMIVYHGSGNKFDEFNHAHMGEGEGAQAHGWGTYVAKEEATSMYYARMGRVSYLGSMSDLDANQQEVINNIINLISVGYTFEEAINEGKEQWKKLSLNSDSRAKRSFLDSLTPDDFKLRYLYSVEIPDDNGSNYFDENDYTDEQIGMISDACEKEGIDFLEVAAIASSMNDRRAGAALYKALISTLGSDKAASEFLSRAGFVGIKYTGRTDGDCFVIFNESDANITGRTEFYQTPDGVVYGWTDGKKIYLTEAGMNPNTPVHEYTHLWARAMMKNNPNGWNSIKQLLKKAPVWDEVIKDKNYESISKDEDAVASEVLSRISGSKNAEKLEQMAQQMIDNAKGTMRKAEARGLIQNIKDALNKFWNWVGKELFKIDSFKSIDEVTDRVLWDLMNQTDLGEMSEGQVETQIVTDPNEQLSRKGDDVNFSESKDEFDRKVRSAADSVGIVKDGLNSLSFSITKVDAHDFEGEHPADKARDWAKKNLVTTKEDREKGRLPKMINGIPYEISGNAISKYLSGKALKKSGDFDAHLSVLKSLKDVIANSVDIEIHPDYLKEDDVRTTNKYGKNVLIHRLYGAISIDGKIYRVKTTMQEFRGNESNKPHSYEVTKIELLDDSMAAGQSATVNGESNPNNSITATKLLKGVEKSYDKGKYLLDESKVVYSTTDIQNAAVDYLVGEPRLRVIENAVNDEASKLGVQVAYKTREQMPDGHKNDKGYFDTETGEIVICTENALSISDAIQTIIHEAVAHKGLRQFMGDKFNEFIDRVYNSLDAETKAKVDALAAEQYDGNTAVAMEEYMASLAEKENFAENSVWDKIKSIFEDIINTILGRDDIKIGDNELRYILRASYNNMVNPRSMDSIRGWAQDQLMREEYKINVATPKILSRTGIDPDTVSEETAKEVYDRVVKAGWQEFQRQFQDAMQPVRIAIDAIQQETGNTPIEDYENFLLMHNQSSSRSRVETDIFRRKHFTPIVEWINKMITDILEARGENVKNRKNRAKVYSEIMQYLIAKHGLERNAYYQEHRTRKLDQSEKDKEKKAVLDAYGERIRSINEDPNLSEAERELELRKAKDEHDAAIAEINEREVPDVRDYSGLTALFGMDSKKFREAEAEAQRLVDEFESSLGEMPRELWDRINAATNKTLRHSYECGLISRRQYNDIKSMFKYYIPLRGFDETTAEDVYSYARFEGNRFSPAVAKAGGRTSLADDPLAFILSMAESEIAQGNKNRAKQALYHFILNRTITDDEGNEQQNTLMQVEDVWYVQNVDDNGNITYTIAVPDHKSGQTIQEFEEKMRELEAEGKAQKSKKGQPELGMRFQKQRNKSAHYVFLKVNGVDKAIYINGDPKAAEAINGMDKSTTGDLAKTMKRINRFISSTFTNYSLEFTARNYFRDMLYSHINIGIKESDPEYRKKFRQNWRHNNLRTMMNMLKAFKEGELDWRNLTEDEAAFVEFMKNGGQTGYTMLNSVENHKRDLEKSIERMRNGVENGGVKDSAVFKYTLGAIELLNEASELVTRFAAFKTSRDLGRDVVTSINDAKEITVNFNTKGAQDGKGWMGMISRYFGWSKFFFNASVQGVQNIKSMSEANKLKFCSVVGGIVASGFMVPVLTAAISQLFGGDEDEYWNIPEYDRQNNFCLVLGKGMYVKIPLPIGFREVYAMGDMVAAMAFDKKFKRDVEQVGMDMANKIASIVLPINPLESQANGLNFWHTFLYTALPSSAQFAIQNATNIDWKGAPLQKEYTYNENDPQWMKAFASNPDWMTGLSKWCNEHIGTGDYKGWDWSPEKLDNILSGLFGGVYSLTKKFGRSISMIWNEENRNLSNIPLSGVVLGSGIDDDDRFVTDAFYEQQDFYDDRIGYIKRRAAKFGYDLDDVFLKEKGKHHPKMQEIYGNKHFDFMQEWYKGSADLKKYDKKVKDQKKKIEAKENPTDYDLEKLGILQDRFNTARREFVDDMLELD